MMATQSLQPARRVGALDLLVVGMVALSSGLALVSPWPQEGTVPVVVPLLLAWGIAGLVIWNDADLKANRRLGKALLVLLGVRLILALAHYAVYWAAGWQKYLDGVVFDAYLYHDYAIRLAAQGLVGSGPWQDLNYSGIVYYYASLYAVFGPNPVVGVIANCLLGGLASVALYKFLLPFSSRRVAVWSAVGLAALPESFLWSSLLMKESLVTFLFVLGLQSGVRMITAPRLTREILPGLCFLGLIELRIALAMTLGGSLLLCLMIHWRRRPRRLFTWLGITAAVMVVIVNVSNVPLIKAFGNPLSPEFYKAYAQAFRARPPEQNAADPSSSLGIRTSGALTEGKFYFIPVRFLMYYLNPPPWVSGYGSWDPFRMSSALVVWLAMPAIGFGLLRLWRARQTTYVLGVPFLLGSTLISSATPFLDDRLRLMMMPLFLAVACWGWEDVRRWRQIYLLVPAAGMIGAAVYYLYKGGWLIP